MKGITMMKILVDLIVFFGLANDDVVQPDEAVRQLEGIAAALQKLTDIEKRQFVKFVQQVAKKEAMEGKDPERVEFLRQLPASLGIEI